MMMLGISLVLAGLAGLYCAWFRRRGTAPHCRRCGFDLAGHGEGERCPECGRSTAGRGTTRGERTRHRGAGALCLVAMLIGVIAITAGRISTHHEAWWREHAPTWWLRFVELEFGEPAHQQRVILELAVRHANGVLGDAAYADAVALAITLLQNGMVAERDALTALVIDAGVAGVIDLESMIAFLRGADVDQRDAFLQAIEAGRIDRVLLQHAALALLDERAALGIELSVPGVEIVLHACDAELLTEEEMTSFVDGADVSGIAKIVMAINLRSLSDAALRGLVTPALRRLEKPVFEDRYWLGELLMQMWHRGVLSDDEKSRAIASIVEVDWSLVSSRRVGGLLLEARMWRDRAGEEVDATFYFAPAPELSVEATVRGPIRVDGVPVTRDTTTPLVFSLLPPERMVRRIPPRRLLVDVPSGIHTFAVTIEYRWRELTPEGRECSFDPWTVTLRADVDAIGLDDSHLGASSIELPETIHDVRLLVEDSIEADPVVITPRDHGLVDVSFTVHCRQLPARFRLGRDIDATTFGLDPDAIIESRRTSGMSDRVNGRMTTFTFVGRDLTLDEPCTAAFPIEHITAGRLLDVELRTPIEVTFPVERGSP